MKSAILIEVCSAEINLCLTGIMDKRDIAFLLFEMHFLLLFCNIGCYKPVAASIALGFFLEAFVDPLGGMPLLTWSFLVLFKPAVYQRLKRIKL